MIFKDLLNKITESDIKSYFQQNEMESKYIDSYLKLYNDLKNRKAEKEDLKLFLVWQQDYFDKGLYISVLGFDTSDKESYALDFMDRSRWLGSEVLEKSLNEFGVVAFVCECLNEMSFISFDEDVIQEEKHILEERVKEIKEGTVEYLSSEEVFGELRDKYGWEVHERTLEEDEEDVKSIEEVRIFNETKMKEMLSEFNV